MRPPPHRHPHHSSISPYLPYPTFSRELGQPPLQLLSPCCNILCQLLLLNNFQNFERHRTGQSRPPIRRRMASGSEHILEFFAKPDRTDGKSCPQALGHRNRIRQKLFPLARFLKDQLVALETTRPIMPALNGIHKQTYPFLLRQLPQSQQIVRRGRNHPSLTLNPLDHHSSCLGTNRLFHSSQIIKGHIDKPGHHGTKSLPQPLLTRRGNHSQCSPMK